MRYSINKGNEKFNKIFEKSLTKSALKHFRSNIYRNLLDAEMNGCSSSELEDSKRMAAYRFKNISKHLSEIIEQQKNLINFHCVNEEIHPHYQMERLKKDNMELKLRVSELEKRIYSMF